MFEIFAKRKGKPFVISPEFAKEILESRTRDDKQEEIREMADAFKKNNLKGQGPVKTKRRK